jgi:single-stranded DNA-binding protein
MSDLNLISISGMVWKDPEKIGENGVKFSVLNGRGTKDKPIKNFFNCVAWGKTAEFILKYIKDRHKVAVVGEMNSRKYEEKTYWDVTAREVSLLNWGNKKDDKPEDLPAGGQVVDPKDVPPVDFDSDIPF